MIEIRFKLKGNSDPKKVQQLLELVNELGPNDFEGRIGVGAQVAVLAGSSLEKDAEGEAEDTAPVKALKEFKDAEEAPKKKKRRTKAEIEADAKAEELKKQQELNAAIAEENEAEEDDAEESHTDPFGNLFDIEDDAEEAPAEDEAEEAKLDTKDPNHMTVLATLVSELREADDKNTKKIQDIMTKKLKAKTVKELSDEQKQVFYSELLKLQ